MANSANEMPPPNRSAAEIDFVLRRAKWRRGPEVLRDLARGQSEPAETDETRREDERRTPTARER